MKKIGKPPAPLRTLVVALHGALALYGPAFAQDTPKTPAALDPASAEMVMPTNYLDIGGVYVDEPSSKFGEYNGLQREGVRPVLNFDLRGGAAYKQDSGSGQRWRIFGNELGLPVRRLGGEYAEQGRWRIGFDYDELPHIVVGDFRTLYNGAGTSTLTLPAAYPAATTRTAATFTNIQTATGAGGGPAVVIPALMHTEAIGAERRRLSVGGEIVLSPDWTLSANARSEKKEGTKLTGVAFGGFRGATLPEPIDSETNILEANAKYARSDVQFGVGYIGSFFHNNVTAWSAENPFFVNATLNNRAVMSSAPSNQAHQLTLDGGWRFRPDTKLTVSGAYARKTQDEPFNYQPGVGQVVAGNHVDAKEIQTNFAARLSHQVNDRLDITAAYRFEHRDSRTPIGTYTFVAADAPTAPNVAARTVNNLPQNRKQQTLSVDGQYNFDTSRVVTLGLERQELRRSFDPPATPLATQENPFLSGAGDENTIRAGYRQEFNENTAGRITLSHSARKARDYFDFPAAGSPPVYPQVPGFRQFFIASRDQDRLRASVDHQFTPDLSAQASVEYQAERYPSRYGQKKADMGVFNLDTTYLVRRDLALNGFVTWEDGRSRQEQYNLAAAALPYMPNPACPTVPAAGSAGNMTDSCREWSATQVDKVLTVGIGVKSSQFMAGKLTLSADILQSRARTNVDFSGGTYSGNPPRFVPAQDMPAITSTLTELRLAAKYQIDDKSAVKFGWRHQRLKSSDPQFDLFGITAVQAYIGTGMTSPRYKVNAVSVSYVYTFR